jgi:hypothetical protein
VNNFVPVAADLFHLDPLLECNLLIYSEEGCWMWQGWGSNGGRKWGNKRYGKIKRGGRSFYIHRWVYTLFWGSIKDGQIVHHTCRQGLCCNPSHLEAIWPEDHTGHHRADGAFQDGANKTNRR